MSKLENALDRMDRAYNRLKPEQGRQGRNNARAKFLAALRDARKAIDEEYPSIPKPRKRRRKPKHPRHLGWKRIDTRTRNILEQRGVSERRFRYAHVVDGRGRRSRAKGWWTEPWIRQALDAGLSYEQIAAASKGGKPRKRLNAMLRLGAKRVG